MKPLAAAKTKYGIWGIIVGACVTMIIGFAWGGWTTSSTVQEMTQDVLVESQAAICVAQFKLSSNYQERLKELGELSSYQKSEYIEKGGWNKMPGQEEANWAVAQSCADGLEPSS